VEDEAQFAPSAQAARSAMARARRAGLTAIVLSAVWRPPLDGLPPAQLARLRRAVRAAKPASIAILVAVYQFSSRTPLTEAERNEFAAYAASVPRLLPQVEGVIVGNEPNTNLFWLPQFDASGRDAAATAYERLLARSYDAIKAVDSNVEVIGGGLASHGDDRPGGKRPSHSPTAFIRDLGAAYRASGRSLPLMDALSIHVYGETSQIPPNLPHLRVSTIGIADYPKLERLLRQAFGAELPIVYGEYGVDTTASPDKRHLYRGRVPASKHPVDPWTQAGYYSEAIRLAACQPLVQMLFFFHVTDERRLEHLQTGLYYADHTPKPGLAEVARTARDAGANRIACR
jgi:hypothetical protein